MEELGHQAWADEKVIVIRVVMPYLANVSKNRARVQTKRGYGITRPEVKQWLDGLTLLMSQGYKEVGEPPIYYPRIVKIHLLRPKKGGGKADPQNFVDFPVDAVATALDLNDNTFVVISYADDVPVGEECLIIEFSARLTNDF